MPVEGFEPAITASERPQTYALDRAAILLSTELLQMSEVASVATQQLCPFDSSADLAVGRPSAMPAHRPHQTRFIPS